MLERCLGIQGLAPEFLCGSMPAWGSWGRRFMGRLRKRFSSRLCIPGQVPCLVALSLLLRWPEPLEPNKALKAKAGVWRELDE